MKKIAVWIIFLFHWQMIYPQAAIHVPQDYPTIQQALNVAALNDTILVSSGTYYENIIWPGVHGIKIIGDPVNPPVINGSHKRLTVITIYRPVIHLHYDSVNYTVLQNLVITGGINDSADDHHYGGGMYVGEPINLILDHVTFTGNTCGDSALAIMGWNYGGGLFYYPLTGSVYRPGPCKIKINHCTFIDNSCGGSDWSYGGGIYLENCDSAMINDSYFINNRTYGHWSYGGGICCEFIHQLSVARCFLSYNATYQSDGHYGYGGAIYQNIQDSTGGSANYTNCLISKNYSDAYPVYLNTDYYYPYGDTALTTMTNLTIADNSGHLSVSDRSAIGLSYSRLRLINSILWNPQMIYEADIYYTDPASYIKPFYCDIRVWNNIPSLGQATNIHLNPQFDSTSYNSPFNYSLLESSACAGAGTMADAPVTDILLHTRPLPFGSNPDMGCYEIDQTVGIQCPDQSLEIKMYPNPANDILYFHCPGLNEPVMFSVCQPAGQTVLSGTLKNSGRHTIDIRNIQSGIYFITIRDTKYISTKKFVKSP